MTLVNALASLAAGGFFYSLFRWLRYRDRLKTVRYLADRHGTDAVKEFLRFDSRRPRG